MTTPTYAQASTPTDQPTFRANTLAMLASPPAPLQPAPVAGWSARSPQRLLVEDFSSQMATESAIRAAIAQTISPQTAALAGADWVRACIGWFGEDYIPALPAVWSVPFQCAPGSAPVTVDASSTIQIQSTDGTIFVCTQASAVVFNSAGSYQGTLQFTARNPGIGGNVAGANILAGKVLTGPAELSIGPSSPTLSVSGRDIETPSQAITRCLGKWAALGAGWTDQAFDYLVPLLSPTVTRHYIDSSNPFGPGTTGLYLADSTGPATTPEVNAVQTRIGGRTVRPNGSGQVVALPATEYADLITVTVQGDGSNPTLATDIANALSSLTALSLTTQLPLGPLYLTRGMLTDICLGRAFSGTTAFQTSAGVYVELAFSLPGFGGAVSVASLTTSQGLSGGGTGAAAADVVPAAQVLVASASVTVL